jgi:hypothetical protein
MKRTTLLLTFAAFLSATTVFADEFTGVISDSHCGAAHHTGSEKDVACVTKCLGSGSDPVLVSNGKVIKINADSRDKAKAFAGQNVKIDGTMEDGSLAINSIDKGSQ